MSIRLFPFFKRDYCFELKGPFFLRSFPFVFKLSIIFGDKISRIFNDLEFLDDGRKWQKISPKDRVIICAAIS